MQVQLEESPLGLPVVPGAQPSPTSAWASEQSRENQSSTSLNLVPKTARYTVDELRVALPVPARDGSVRSTAEKMFTKLITPCLPTPGQGGSPSAKDLRTPTRAAPGLMGPLRKDRSPS